MALISLITALLTAGCGGLDTAEWSEEVQLHDGKAIVVKMKATRGSSGFPDSRRGGYRGYEIQFASPATTWVENNIAGMVPIAVDVQNGTPFVVVLIGHCNICKTLGNPDPSLMVWKWTGGQWQRANYDELPKGLRLNIMGDPWDALHHDDPTSAGKRRDLSGNYSLQKKTDDICRFDSCKDNFNRLLSEYVEAKQGQYNPGKVCIETCKTENTPYK